VNFRAFTALMNGPLVLVTPRAVELLLPAPGWTAVDVARVCGQIESLPETPDRDGWSRRVA
jgi:hypothetical protein